METPSNGVVVHIYCDVPVDDGTQPASKPYHHVTDYGRTYTALELCMQVAQELNIGSLAFNLFGLQAMEEPFHWLPPNGEIECCEDSCQNFRFSMRFRPPQSKMYQLATKIDEDAFKYFFLQCRHDFVNDRIHYKDGKLSQDRSLGLGVTDIVRYGRQYGKDSTYLTSKVNPKLFIPLSEKRVFKSIIDKKRLALNFKEPVEKELRECERKSLTDIKLRYIYEGIISYAPDYGIEEFSVAGNETLRVQPLDENSPGLICIQKNGSVHVSILFPYFVGLFCIVHWIANASLLSFPLQTKTHFATIKDMMTITVSYDKTTQGTQVLISRKSGMPKVCCLRTENLLQ